jgi:hypothetical protein
MDAVLNGIALVMRPLMAAAKSIGVGHRGHTGFLDVPLDVVRPIGAQTATIP